MSIGRTKFRGKVRIKGRPREMARAEIMLMKQKEGYENRQRRRKFFVALDVVAVLSLLVSIYAFYVGRIVNGFLSLIPAILIIIYFVLRNKQRNNKN